MPHSPAPLLDRIPRLCTGLAAAGALAVIALTGCAAQSPAASSSPSATSAETPGTPAPDGSQPTASVDPTPGSTATSTAAPTPTAPSVTGTKLSIGCGTVLSAEDVYDFNPNYGTDPGYTPKPGSFGAKAVEAGGVSCGWLNQSSGQVFEVGVAKPDAASMTTLKNQAASSGAAVPTYGTPPDVEGFFAKTGNTGTAQVFTGGYWIVTSSDAFFEPGDVQKLVGTIESNLP